MLAREMPLRQITDVLKSDSRILKAWVFGSFARSQGSENSDIDIMIRVDESSTFSLFDLADIQYLGEKSTGYKIDIVVEGAVKAFALENVNKDLILIYEK